MSYLPRQKAVNPPHPKRVGTSVFAAEQLVVLCYWLVGYALTFLIGCRFWVCFFTRVMLVWHFGGWLSVRGSVPVGVSWRVVRCCGTLWRPSAATSVGAAPGNVCSGSRFTSRPAEYAKLLCCCAVPHVFPVNTGNISRSISFTSFPAHEQSF